MANILTEEEKRKLIEQAIDYDGGGLAYTNPDILMELAVKVGQDKERAKWLHNIEKLKVSSDFPALWNDALEALCKKLKIEGVE